MSADNSILNAEKLFLLCARYPTLKPFEKEFSGVLKTDIDWKFFVESTVYEGLSFVTIAALSHMNALSIIPKDFRDTLLAENIFAEHKINLQLKETNRLLSIFSQSKVQAVFLKGPLLSERLYGDFKYRGRSTDIDILINEEQLKKVHSLLRQAGYKDLPPETVKGATWQINYIDKKRNLVDLQWKISPIFSGPLVMEYFWNNTLIKQDTSGLVSYDFNKEALLLFLSRHFVRSNHITQIKYLCDLNMIFKNEKNLDWQKVIADAKTLKFSSSLYICMKLCLDVFGTPVPPLYLRALKPNPLKCILISTFTNKRILLPRKTALKSLMNSSFAYLFFSLMEADSLGAYFKIFFPPLDLMGKESHYERFKRIFTKLSQILWNSFIKKN